MTDRTGRASKKTRGPSSGAIGGSAAEAGATFRSGVAAWVIAHGLKGVALPKLFPSVPKIVPIRVELEVDSPVDDIAVTFDGGERAYIRAKRSLDFSLSPDSQFMAAVNQWREAATQAGSDLGATRLVLVVQAASGSVMTLAKALDRNRAAVAGALTADEHAAMEKLSNALGEISVDRRVKLLRAIEIIRLDLEHDGFGDAGIAISHLDGWVVPTGEGVRAWRALKGKSSDLAVLRQGLSMEGWMGALREAGLSLVADARKSASARREAAGLVEIAYRSRMVRDGSVIDLRPLGAPLAPLDAEDTLDAIKVEPPASGTDQGSRLRGRGMIPAFRRRGRCLLLGLPGSGKSTALLVAAAHWAKESSWPLPVLVNLKDMTGTMHQISPLDALIDQATRDLPPQERELLADRIRAGVSDGMLAVFLDGLDETRDRRLDMVRYIERLLKQIHADVEVFLSTRDIGYAQASTLGFKELRLPPPERMNPLLQRVLTKLAEQDEKLQTDQRQQWVSRRLTWVETILRNDHQLEETPLMPLIVTLLAADASESPLVKSRAQIISLVVESVARRWMMAPARETQLGTLSPNEAKDALIDAFDAIGIALLKRNSLSRSGALESIIQLFRERWGMHAGPARTAADEALHFWDEAGIIVGEGAEPQLSARVRIFAEIGGARFLSKMAPPELRESLRELVSEETSHEALLLGAELSQTVATELIEIARASPSLELELILARALTEGATTTPAALDTLVELLLNRIGDDPQENWEIAKAIVRVPVPAERTDSVLAAIESSLPQEPATLAKAVASVTWGPVDIELIRDALKTGPPHKWASSGGGKPTARRPPFVDDGFLFLVERVAEKVLPEHAEIAPDLVAGAAQSSLGTSERVYDLLARHGHNDLVAEARRHLSTSFSAFTEPRLYAKGFGIFLHSIESLGKPIALSLRQQRRLDEIADYVATLHDDEAGIVQFIRALFGPAEDLKATMKAVQVLGGFEPDILSSQVHSLLRETDSEIYHDILNLLFDGGTSRTLDRWDAPEDRGELETRLVSLLGNDSLWLASLATTALSHSQHRQALVQRIESQISGLRLENRWLAAHLVCHLDRSEERADGWIASHDHVLREAGAALAGDLFRETRTGEERLVVLLSDKDSGIREATIRSLEGLDISPSLIKHLGLVASDPGESWTCRSCGESNDGKRRTCEKCRTVGPDPQKAATAVLERALEAD